MMRILAILSALLIISFNSFGQKGQIEDFFRSYVDAINQINQTKNLDEVMDYFHPDFQINRTFIGPNGRVERAQLSLTAFASSLQGLTSDRDIQTNLKIEQISKVIEGPTTATISAVLSLNMNVDGNFAEEGGMVTNYAMVKGEDGKWKFVHSDVVRTLVKRNAGNCPCRFYQRENALVAEVWYPVGFEYKNELQSFKFRTVDQVRYVSNNLKEYVWDENGAMSTAGDDANTSLGNASDQKEAAQLILGELYRMHCLSFRRY